MTIEEFMDSLPEVVAHQGTERCARCGRAITDAEEGRLCAPAVHEIAERAGVTYTAVTHWVIKGQVPNAETRTRLGLEDKR